MWRSGKRDQYHQHHRKHSINYSIYNTFSHTISQRSILHTPISYSLSSTTSLHRDFKRPRERTRERAGLAPVLEHAALVRRYDLPAYQEQIAASRVPPVTTAAPDVAKNEPAIRLPLQRNY